MMSFSTYVFAEEIGIQKSTLNTDINSIGSMIRTQTVSENNSVWIFITTTEPVLYIKM